MSQSITIDMPSRTEAIDTLERDGRALLRSLRRWEWFHKFAAGTFALLTFAGGLLEVHMRNVTAVMVQKTNELEDARKVLVQERSRVWDLQTKLQDAIDRVHLEKRNP